MTPPLEREEPGFGGSRGRANVWDQALSKAKKATKLAVVPFPSRPEEDLVHAAKKVHLHVRYSTQRKNTVPKVALSAIVWFEDGSLIGPLKVKTRRLNSEAGLAHLEHLGVCEIANVPFPSSPVAFVQLTRKRINPIKGYFGIEDTFTIQDAFIKIGSDPSPTGELLAYFSFSGVLVDKSHLLLTNLLTHERKLEKSDVQDDPINAGKRLQVRSVSLPKWASADEAGSMVTKYRAITDGIALGKCRSFVAFMLDLMMDRNLPVVANAKLGLDLDVVRYGATPGFAPIPPLDYTFSEIKFDEFMGKRYEPVPFAAKQVIRNPHPWRMSMVDFSQFLEKQGTPFAKREVIEIKRVMEWHMTDEEFGRLITEGLFCTQITVVPENPDDRPLWLNELIAEAKPTSSRLFYMDYTSLVGVPRNEEIGCHFTPARCLLEHNGIALRPIAIALFYCREYYDDIVTQAVGAEHLPVREESKEDRKSRRLNEGIWMTHLPSHASWQVAKLFCKCAASQHHQIVAHALYTHMVIEPFVIALELCVPSSHILYRLLKAHFRYTLDVNFKARTALISQGGIFDQFISTGGIHAGHLKFMAKTFKEWTVDKMILPQELASRGFVKDPRHEDAELPEYMYAQDAMTIWDAIEEYVRGVILRAYPTEKEFSTDFTVRNYFMEIMTHGFPTSPSFVPSTRSDLISIITGVIFTSTAQHAAVNFPQFAHFGLIINSPVSLRRRAPEPDVPSSLYSFLPDEEQATRIIASAWGLSRFVPVEERFLGTPTYPGTSKEFFNLSLSTDPHYREVCDAFVARMDSIDKHMVTRPPSKYGTHYSWLRPSMIPISIAT